MKYLKLFENHEVLDQNFLMNVAKNAIRNNSMDMINYATMLMPLTTYNRVKDRDIQKKVWQYCVKHNIKYSSRLHVDIWGMKRRV